jgi:hypothetical protein
MMGYLCHSLCLCPPAVCRPSALTYSCRPRSSDADNLRILLSNSYRACSQENDKYDFDPQDDLIDQLHLDMGRIYRDLEKQPRFGLIPLGDGGSCSTGQIGALMAESFCERILSCAKQVVHRHRLSYKAEEYSMVVILRMNRAFMEYMRKHEKDYEPGK